MKKLLSVLLCIAMIFALATGCGGNSNEADDSGDRIVRIGKTMANLQTLDVWHSSMNPTFQVSDAMFDRLIDKNPETLELQLNLLEDWPEISEDRTVYTFKLKKGVKFHDGSELTSEDVEFTFNYFYNRDTASENTWVCEVIKGCQEMMAGEADTLEGFKVIDDYTFSIELLYPYSAFEAVLATSMLPILPKEARLEAGDAWGTSVLIGSGPYKLKSFTPAESLEMEVFEDYHGTKPNVDGIQMVNMDNSTALMEWEAGNIDFCEVPSDLVADYRERFPDQLQEQVLLGSIRLQLNSSIPPLDDLNVRKAIAMSIDRDEIVDGYYQGNVKKLNGILPDGIPGFDPNAKAYEYDPEGAKALLAESGYSDGVEITATVRESSEGFKQVLQIIQEQLKKVGITMNIEQVDSASYIEIRGGNKMQTMLGDWYADFTDADMYLYTLFHSDYSAAYSNGYSNEWYDEQVEKARSMEGDEKAELYKELDAFLTMEEVAYVPIFQDMGFCLCSDRVSGVFMKKDCLYTFANASIN